MNFQFQSVSSKPENIATKEKILIKQKQEIEKEKGKNEENPKRSVTEQED